MSAANNANPPVVFTQDELGWVSWIDPLLEAELTERHFAGLVDRSRSKSEYFRLLVRDPEVLEARTKTDKDIFYNVADGLPRAERELAAAATSRYNGCIYCASVHARFASTYSKRRDDVQRLLDEGRRRRSRRALECGRQGLGGVGCDADRVQRRQYR
ncbi:alkylhydroperoxidase domain protein [Bradyrhizobium sp. GM2.4]